MNDSLNLIRADQLRVGDVIIANGYPADIINVRRFLFGNVCLIFGVGRRDWLSFPPDATFNVVGRMSDPVVGWPHA